MACLEPAGLMEQEEKYLHTIQQAAAYERDGQTLSILDEQGNRLLAYRILPEFEANPDGLQGKTWQLSHAGGMEASEPGAFTLRFEGNTFNGTTSCRDYRGSYQAQQDQLTVTFLEMTTHEDCAPEDLISEETYTTLLERIDQYQVSPDRLELCTVQRDKLIFESISE